MLDQSQLIVDRLIAFQRDVRDALIASRSAKDLREIAHHSKADVIYRIDAVVDPILVEFCRDWSRTTPLVLISEGLKDDNGDEVDHLVFPRGTREDAATVRVIVDPIDGTRGIMYDKRPAWALAGVAPNKGPLTRLSDIDVAVMTELPTSKMGQADVLWAIRGQGAHARRVNLLTRAEADLPLRPSQAEGIEHGFAMVSNFFPGTKVIASELMEAVALELLGAADVTKATVFEDQYISTGGQFYELIAGHDRFNADVRPLLHRALRQPEGLCCHPYDCATVLIAREAGVIVTDGLGADLDGPLDTTTGLSWAAYANPVLRQRIEPVLRRFFAERGVS